MITFHVIYVCNNDQYTCKYNHIHKANTNEYIIRLLNHGVARSPTKFTNVYHFQDVNVWEACHTKGDAHT